MRNRLPRPACRTAAGAGQVGGAGRFDCSSTKPFTSIKVAGQEFAKVEMVNTSEMADRVAAAMAAKYTSDILVRYMTHPYTMKLVPRAE